MNNFSFLLKKVLVFTFFISFSIGCFGQFDHIEYDDVIYDETIHSVQFYPANRPLDQPIINLDSDSTLLFSFDDLGEDLKDLYYTIIHCNADWQPSELTTLEYLDGFDENQLVDPDFSVNTLTEYSNYELVLPNDNLNWTKSGNYILVVYEYGNEASPIITRRFMVVDNKVKIAPNLVRPSNIEKAKTHQEIDFSLVYENLMVKDAQKELKATVLQNGRWDNAITDIPPLFIQRDKLLFDYQDKISFFAGKEFRYVDLRSFRYKNERVISIQEYQNLYEITLEPDHDLAHAAYQYIKDANGNFLIQNIHELSESNLRSDYALVLFSIEKNMPYTQADVYLFGKMTDWKIQEKFKLAYSEKLQLYAADVLLKQGYYNYVYAVVPRGKTNTYNTEELEGSWYETANEYTILIYHRPFGGRYDQLVGISVFGSNND